MQKETKYLYITVCITNGERGHTYVETRVSSPDRYTCVNTCVSYVMRSRHRATLKLFSVFRDPSDHTHFHHHPDGSTILLPYGSLPRK